MAPSPKTAAAQPTRARPLTATRRSRPHLFFLCSGRATADFVIGLSLRSLTAKTTPELFIPRRRSLLPRFRSSYQNVITNHHRAMCVCSVHYQPCSTLLFPLLEEKKRESMCLSCKNARTRENNNKGVCRCLFWTEASVFWIPALLCWLSAARKRRLL